ncbi:sulfotransferase [Novosphingobium flavum]|uniref:Sulfotransferase n=1 Tax=Novosphingobium flavum TaxID=1778672 RepID=A0A7X1FTI8_9SPHN|nr:sulfotransferase [Novosphingobium flavum]MBC2666082.1 sulfotransferase [Novosphingobium flavum]
MSAAPISARLAAATRDPQLLRAALALHQNRLAEAEPLLKNHLKADPFDVAAIRMLAELAARIGRTRDAETLLRRALELAPDFGAARVNLATVLYRSNRAAEALAELDRLVLESEEDDNPNLRAAVLNRLGEFEQALALYEDTLERRSDQPRVWMSYGHVLKTVGRLGEAVAAYRRATALQPGFGEAWWSLANLKTVRLDEADIAAMEQALAGKGNTPEDRFHLEFAAAKAWEDAGYPARAFASYSAANAHRRALIHYDAAETTGRVDRMIAGFTQRFARGPAGGCPAADPIFIVGLPRAGSTLVEQILASHSQVEAIAELPDIPELWSKLGGADGKGNPHERFAGLSADELRAIGEEYLRRVSPQRKTDRPLFIDKLPNNWLYVGFIRAILPNARIVDARRHPLSAGVANFRQHFARGQHFAYDLADLGHYYRDYVRLMDAFERVCPGAVYRVTYERMVDDSEGEIRALLDGLGLPFERDCLEFHKTERPVRTPSSEQVRSPIFRQGTENWQAYDQWLGPLREALGPALVAGDQP